MDYEKLDFLQIRRLLENNGKVEELKKIVRLAVLKIDGVNPEFFQGLEIEEELLEKNKDNSEVMFALAVNKALPSKKIGEYALGCCGYLQVKSLYIKGIIKEDEFVNKVRSYKEKKWIIDAILTFPNLRDFLIEDIGKYELTTLDCVEIFKLPYRDSNLKLAKTIAINMKKNNIFQFGSNILYKLFVYFNPESKFLFLKSRPDLEFIFKNLPNNFRNNFEGDLDKKRVLEGEFRDYAKYLDFFNDSNINWVSLRVILLNNWAKTGNILAYSVYADYFLTENRDYEGAGKYLDLEYSLELDKIDKERYNGHNL